MSSWIHVSGVFNIDGVEGNELDDDLTFSDLIDKKLGKELRYEDDYDKWDYAFKHKNEFLPLGSEGSLHKSIWKNPDKDSLNMAVITVFGNLRDCYNVDEYIEWFKKKCEQFYIRQAVITVTNGWETKTWTYGENENGVD